MNAHIKLKAASKFGNFNKKADINIDSSNIVKESKKQEADEEDN